MRVLVCGGRGFHDKAHLFKVLDKFNEQRTVLCLIHGCARGADSFAEEWASQPGRDGVVIERYPADWNAHGNKAGPIRNFKMLMEGRPDVVIAFPGGRGTANMIQQAVKAGVEVIIIRENSN